MKDFKQTAIRFKSSVSNGRFKPLSEEKRSYTRTEKKVLSFLSMESDLDTIALLETNPNAFFRIIHAPVYSERKIKKKNGGDRSLDIPEESLKVLQQKLNDHLQSIYTFLRPECTHGFVRYLGRRSSNILKNASAHTSRAFILNLDLKDFFHSVKSNRIKAVFQNSPFYFDEHLANTLMLITTHKNRLPQGAPTSPVLSNFASINLDNNISTLCKAYGIRYTRYADDLTFSSNTPIPETFKIELYTTIDNEGYLVNYKKTRMRSKNRKQLVTGVVVNKRANVNRKYIRKLRSMIFDMEQNDISNAAARHLGLSVIPNSEHINLFLRRLNGMLAFIGQIRGKQDPLTVKLKNRFLKTVKSEKILQH